MKRIIILTICFICLCAFVSENVWAGKTWAYVYVKNKNNSRINASVKMDGSGMSRRRTGFYRKRASEGYHTFSAQKGWEKKSKRSKVRPPRRKVVRIRFNRH